MSIRDAGDLPAIRVHDDSNPMSSFPAPLSPTRTIDGCGVWHATSTRRAHQPALKSTLSSPLHSQASCWGVRRTTQRDWHPEEGEWAQCQGRSHSLARRWQESSAHPLHSYPWVIVSWEHSMTGLIIKSPQTDHPLFSSKFSLPVTSDACTWRENNQLTSKQNQTERDKGMSFLAESNQTAIKKSSG